MSSFKNIFFISVTALLLPTICSAKIYDSDSLSKENISFNHRHQKSINIYIISKDKYYDLINRLIAVQAKIASLLHRRKLKIIMAASTADAEKKITALVYKKHYAISNLWFDSHGKYRKGYSSFMIGIDEYYYKNILDNSHDAELKKIASLCNQNTNIGIGSCYAAADFSFPVEKNGEYYNMHGDSLLKGMSSIFNGSPVYACESWVMAKPGIFGKENALAGYPIDKEYKDIIFKPVWNRMGMWRRYSSNASNFENINTVYLSKTGEILTQEKTYMSQKKAQRKLRRNLKRLRPGLYSLVKK